MTATSTGYNWSNASQWSKVPSMNNQSQQSNTIPTSNLQNNSYTNQYYAPVSQESRKDMITRLYRTILGREPDMAGLNYYLYNTHISELQIAKDMFESTEHADILMKAKDIREMIKRSDESLKKVSEMQYSLDSLKSLNENYKTLLEQKTQIINQLRAQLGIAEEENTSNTNINQSQIVDPSDSIVLMDPFEEDYSSRKGCMGWIKNWFKFN